MVVKTGASQIKHSKDNEQNCSRVFNNQNVKGNRRQPVEIQKQIKLNAEV